MRVFRCFFQILKRKKGYIFMYMGIFFSISLAISMQGKESEKNFEKEKISLCLFDEDHSEISEGLAAFLKSENNWVEVADDEELIQEKLYQRNITCVVRIPKGFGEKIVKGEEDHIRVKTIPGTMYGEIMEQSIHGFLSLLQGYLAADESEVQAVEKTTAAVGQKIEVEMTSQNGGTAHSSSYYLFAYVPYLFLAICIGTLTPILMVFRKKEIAERMACSSYPKFKVYREIYLSFILAGLVIAAIHLILVFFLGKDIRFTVKGGLYAINEIAFMFVTLSMVFLVSQLAKKMESISMISNVLSLAMSFLCGVFVPLSFLGDGVKKAAHFLPAYWYIRAAEQIDSWKKGAEVGSIWMFCGIQMLFAIVILTVALVVKEKRRK